MAQVIMPSKAPTQLEALATALDIGKSLYGISTQREQMELERADEQRKIAAANQEAQLKGYQISALENEMQQKKKQEALNERLAKGDFQSPIELLKFQTENKLLLSDKPTNLGATLKGQPIYFKPQSDVEQQYKMAQLEGEKARTEKTRKEIGQIGKLSPVDEQKLANLKIEYQKLLNPSEKDLFAKLPTENQDQIKEFASKNVKLMTIHNEIKSALNTLRDPKLDEKQKIVQGKMLLKTLNSSQGSDAIGSEEAKRLGNYLEYKIFNFTEPGSFIGTDLDEFIKQTSLAADKINGTIKLNQNEIKNLRTGAQTDFQNLAGKSEYEKSKEYLNKSRGGFIRDAQASDSIPTFDPTASFKPVWRKQ